MVVGLPIFVFSLFHYYRTLPEYSEIQNKDSLLSMQLDEGKLLISGKGNMSRNNVGNFCFVPLEGKYMILLLFSSCSAVWNMKMGTRHPGEYKENSTGIIK